MTAPAQNKLLSPQELQPANQVTARILEEMNRIILGQSDNHKMILVAMISLGHVLLEGVPGVGKTVLVKTLSRLLGLSHNRVQFTPDLMPGDILGNHILQEREQGNRELVFQQGPVFTNILLADEINRASPKTQSALLEAMQEKSVTLLGKTRELPRPFFVLATQNPIELEGTYPLPEAQLDRFLFKLNVKMVDPRTLTHIISERRRGEPPEPEWTTDASGLKTIDAAMDRILLPEAVASYISRLVGATHPESSEAVSSVNTYVSFGASPRAAIAISESARALALINGRPTAGFEDVETVAPFTLNHRLILNYKARIDRVDTFAVIKDLLQTVRAADMDLPEKVSVL